MTNNRFISFATAMLIVVTMTGFELVGRAAGDVRYVAPSGSDANPGTAELPWRTIGKAVKEDGVVIVAEGIYRENVLIGKSVELYSQGAVIEGVDTGVLVPCVKVTGSDVVVDGFVIRNCYGWGVWLAGQRGRLVNSVILDVVEDGVYVSGTGNLVSGNDISMVRNYRVAGSTWRGDMNGVVFFGSAHTIEGNWIHDINHGDALHYTSCSDTQAKTSASCWPHIDGLQTWGPAQDIVIKRNRVHLPLSRLPDGTVLKSLMTKYAMVSRSQTGYALSNISFEGNEFISSSANTWHPVQIGHDACTSSYTITGVVFEGNTFQAVSGDMAVLMQCINGVTFSGNSYSGYSQHYRVLKSVAGLVDNDGAVVPTAVPTVVPTVIPTAVPSPTTVPGACAEFWLGDRHYMLCEIP